MEPILIVHGGAGWVPDSRIHIKFEGTKLAIRVGYKVLLEEDDPLGAVEKAINVMENLPGFNAGYGSVLTRSGEVEMDALIMQGTDLKAGGVGAVKHIQNPISLARLVMEKTEHALLVGIGAEEFAKSQNIPIVSTESLIPPKHTATTDPNSKTTETSFAIDEPLEDQGKSGTVGAVAINSKGVIIAGTSTGGMQNTLDGRVGDTPIIGAGTIADDEIGGVSATGVGEAIMRSCLSSRILNYMEQGNSAKEASLRALSFMLSKIPDGRGGVIVISKSGEVAYEFKSKRMSWAYVKTDKLIRYGINPGEEFTEQM